MDATVSYWTDSSRKPNGLDHADVDELVDTVRGLLTGQPHVVRIQITVGPTAQHPDAAASP